MTETALLGVPVMVVLRFKRLGRIHSPFFRLCAMDHRSPRDGRAIEELGWYSPQGKDGKQVEFKAERIRYWLSVGAQPSETVRSLLRKAGIDPTSGAKAAAPAAAEAS